MPPPPDPTAELRRRAAQRLRALADKQQRMAASWLSTLNSYTSTSSALLADSLENGTFEPGRWWSAAVALGVESAATGLDACVGLGASVGGGPIQQIAFSVDDQAQTSGPLPLSGAVASQDANVTCGDLLPVGGGAALVPPMTVSKSTQGDDLLVEVGNLRPAGVARPRGAYAGPVTLTAPDGTVQQIAVVILLRI